MLRNTTSTKVQVCERLIGPYLRAVAWLAENLGNYAEFVGLRGVCKGVAAVGRGSAD